MSKRVIQKNGLSFVQIGDKMPEEGLKRLKGRSLRDTVFVEEGYSWRAAILEYKDGKVYVEEDFWGQHLVNRIRIESPSLFVKKGIKVGMTMAELKPFSTQWEAVYLETYQVLDLIKTSQPSIHYLIQEPDPASRSSSETPILVDDIPDQSHVVAIVVM